MDQKPPVAAPDQLPRRSETEKKILDAARVEFVAKGRAGARMQSVAASAGVNKALVHYYFRSKQKLYEAVLQDILTKFWGTVREAVHAHPQTGDIRRLIHTIVSLYIRTMQANPDFPRLFLREVADGGSFLPEVIQGILSHFLDVPQAVFATLKRESARGTIRPIEPLHFAMNLMGMCASTFIAKPIVDELQRRMPGMRTLDTEEYFEARIEAITQMACDGICIQGNRK